MPDYNFFRADSPSGRKIHGVGLFVRKGIPVLKADCDLPNVLIARLIQMNMTVVLVYRPPRADSRFLAQLYELLNRTYDTCHEMCLLGDFNLPGLTWDEELVTRNATPQEREYFNMFNEMCLSQIVNFPTFLSSSNILDLVFLTDEDRYSSLDFSQPFPGCGHVIIHFELMFNSNEKDESTRRDWSRGNYAVITEAFSGVDWDFEFSHRTREEKCLIFCDFYMECIQTHVPFLSNRRKKQAPWMRRVPGRYISTRNESWQRLLVARRANGRRSLEYRTELRTYRTACNEYASACLSERNEYEHDLLRRSKSAPKAFYGYISKGRKNRPTIGPLKTLDNSTVVTGSAEMSEVLADAYVSSYTNQRLSNQHPHQVCAQITESIPFSARELRDRLKKLKVDKAMGPDMVHPRVLRSCADAISVPLAKIISESFSTAEIPAIWKKAEVIPIYKGGDRTSAAQHRPVSLTCLPCKLSESFIVDALTNHLTTNDILSNSQFGFRSGRS